MKYCFLLCTDSHEPTFSKGLLITINSIKKTNPNIPIVVMYDYLEEYQIAALKGCELMHVDGSIFNADHRKDLGTAAYFRFYVNKLDYDKVLYVDSDMVVLDDLSEIFHMDEKLISVKFKNRELTREFTNPDEILEGEKLDAWGPVLISGFLCFDNIFWKEQNLLKIALDTANKYDWSSFKCCDQGIFNVIVQKYGFKDVGFRYNFFTHLQNERPEIIKTNPLGFKAPFVNDEFVKILHWNGPQYKPWVKENKPLYKECYLQFS